MRKSTRLRGKLKPTTPTSHDSQLIKMALVIARLDAKARAQRKDLKIIERELRTKRRELKAYAQSFTDTVIEAQQVPAMRLFGERIENT